MMTIGDGRERERGASGVRKVSEKSAERHAKVKVSARAKPRSKPRQREVSRARVSQGQSRVSQRSPPHEVKMSQGDNEVTRALGFGSDKGARVRR